MAKIKIAFVKFGGLAAGGTERFIQNIAANLPQDRYDVTYFYCDAAPYVGSDWKHPDTDLGRKKFMEDAGIKLVKFNVAAKDVTKPHHPWLETNFFEVFNEQDFDIIQTGRAGHPEYPFTEIHSTPIVDAITLPGLAENKANVAKVIHISDYQAGTWIAAGGDASKCIVVPVFSDVKIEGDESSFREELGIGPDDVVFGMHQRDDDGIASPVPLQAYKLAQTDRARFVIMGGSQKYTEWAKQLDLKGFYQLPHSGDSGALNKFLNTLDVFAHGRADGETFGLSIAEGMSFGLPVISHVAPATGHVATIGAAGKVVQSVDEYAAEMSKHIKEGAYRNLVGQIAEKEYQERLSTEVNMKTVLGIYEEVMVKKVINDLPDEEFWEAMYDED